MHALHELLLKKNARRISLENQRAFYYAEDKPSDAQILHIDRKIQKTTRFSSIKKLNRTLEAFDDDAYRLSSKAKFCVGMVSRVDGELVFEVSLKKGISLAQLARSLRRFKRLIGSASVGAGARTDAEEASADPAVNLSALSTLLTAWQTAHSNTDRAKGDDEILACLALEERAVERCLHAISVYYDTTAALGESDAQASRRAVLHQTVAQWEAQLEDASEFIVDLLGTSGDEDADLVEAIREELRAANLTDVLHGSAEQLQAELSNYLLYQQQIFRRADTQVHGRLDPNELFFTDVDGRPVPVTAAFLRDSGLSEAFVIQDGSLVLVPPFISEDGIDVDSRNALSALLVEAVERGFGLHLRNPSGGGRVELDLQLGKDGVEGAVRHNVPASPSNLQLGRSEELVPGSEPPRSFSALISAMGALALDDEDGFNALNEQLHDAYMLEVRAGRVSEEMDFTTYKMQFVQLDVPAVDESGLRWRDGDDHLNVAEWAFLQQKVQDLPQKAQHYYQTSYTPLGVEEPKTELELTPYPIDFRTIASKKKRRAAFRKVIAKLVDLDRWKVELGAYIYSVPGQDDLLGAVRAIPPQTIRTLLAGPDGDVRNPKNRRAVDATSARSLSGVADEVADMIGHTVMRAAMTHWTENAGRSVRRLLQDIPDTQRVFLRQSNGTNNADAVARSLIGQTEVTQAGEDEEGNLSGNNDNGAFGKCAPTSYFCGAICGIAVSANDGLKLLKDDALTRNIAEEVEALLCAVPCNEDSQDALDAALKRLRSVISRARRGASTQRKASLKALQDAASHVKQMKTSVVDRMVVKSDRHGPYMEMSFYIPDTRSDPYLSDADPPLNTRPRKKKVKVRPEHIQEYLEQTNRADGYRGGKKHMMDFFKDPSSMNQIQLMENVGPGLIAVGIDQALKSLGKASGLLYGPGSGTVAAMVYNHAMDEGEYLDLKKPHTGTPGSREFEQASRARRDALVSMLQTASERGGGLAVSMGYNLDTGHVNYVQAWGTPRLGGVSIEAADLARCHMNYTENSGSSSAWQGDRNVDTMINTGKMAEGLTAIQKTLAANGQHALVRELTRLLSAVVDAQHQMDAVAAENGFGSAAEWAREVVSDWNASNAFMRFKMDGHPALDAVRAATADVMDWLKANLLLDHSEAGMDPDNVALMPSNTERDTAMTDSEADRDRVGGGNIGSQTRGSANATDASYFVPLNCLANGWDGVDDKANGYAGMADPTDQFVMLSDIELMA